MVTGKHVGLTRYFIKVSTRMTSLTASWQSSKVVRTREKVSFFLGVMNLLFSSLIFAIAPEYVLFLVPCTCI